MPTDFEQGIVKAIRDRSEQMSPAELIGYLESLPADERQEVEALLGAEHVPYGWMGDSVFNVVELKQSAAGSFITLEVASRALTVKLFDRVNLGGEIWQIHAGVSHEETALLKGARVEAWLEAFVGTFRERVEITRYWQRQLLKENQE